MCYEFWKEFKGWCKAFLLTEILLALLQTFLLILCIVFMVFLIMHMMVCQTWTSDTSHIVNTTTKSPHNEVTMSDNDKKVDQQTTAVDQPKGSTLDPRVKCTWTPSSKTDAASRYYEQTKTTTVLRTNSEATATDKTLNISDKIKPKFSPTMNITYNKAELEGQLEGIDQLALDDDSDGEEVSDQRLGALLALVKPAGAGRRRGTFGCVLTAITHYWVLTAASCIEAIEEVDSLDEFVILERSRRGAGTRHAIADVQLHPLWAGAGGGYNRTHDAAALRSEEPFRTALTPLDLPTLPDYFLITIGERFTILGFGPFRSSEPTSEEREVRAVNVYTLPLAMCRQPPPDQGVEDAEGEGDDGSGGGGGGWAQRHLSRGHEEPHSNGGCGATWVCAGVRWARGASCGYCAGTPLVATATRPRRHTLLGLMAGGPTACAADCAPAAYVNLALIRDWIDMLLIPD